jgi:hypothetical protein
MTASFISGNRPFFGAVNYFMMPHAHCLLHCVSAKVEHCFHQLQKLQ